jgi:phosphoribosylamine--glycine ligase
MVFDFFEDDQDLAAVHIVGPSKAAAKLEGSKDFCKEFMARNNIPTAAYKTFGIEDLEEGVKYLETIQPPYVLKADGLAAGKGVIITRDLPEAQAILQEMIVDKKFGDASSKVVIEEFLDGIELSVFVLTDGKSYVTLPEAKDYKRIGEGDTGLNTGGMGALSPVPFADAAVMKQINEKIIKPTVDGLQSENMKYRGFIFFGLIKCGDDIKVIEYNVRMGDPETEVVIPRVKSDLVPLLIAAASSKLEGYSIECIQEAASTVMLVAGGYPEPYQKGDEIFGLDKVENVIPFHAGTTISEGKLVTNGGRVLALTSLGNDIFHALDTSKAAAEVVTWEGRNYRKDIGFDLKCFV